MRTANCAAPIFMRRHNKIQSGSITLLCPFCKYACIKFVTGSHWQHLMQFQGHAPFGQSLNTLPFFFFPALNKYLGIIPLSHTDEKKYSPKER